MSTKEEKSGVKKMRELHQEIRKGLKPSRNLIDTLIKSGKVKRKDESEKKIAKPYSPEAGV
jgi:hypothetical protein